MFCFRSRISFNSHPDAVFQSKQIYSLWNQEQCSTDNSYIDVLVDNNPVMHGEDPLCSQVCAPVENLQESAMDQCGVTFSQEQFESRIDIGSPPTSGIDCFESTSVGSECVYAEQAVQYADPRPESKPEEHILFKSLNFLPFTERFKMLRNGSTMRLVDSNPRQSVVITDKKPPAYSSKQR